MEEIKEIKELEEIKEKSLFIIEDDKSFRERLTTSFQRKDFIVTAAASKKEALEILAKFSFNYAIVDLRLGDGSGLDVIKVIKEQKPIPPRPYINTFLFKVNFGCFKIIPAPVERAHPNKVANFRLKNFGFFTILFSEIKL